MASRRTTFLLLAAVLLGVVAGLEWFLVRLGRADTAPPSAVQGKVHDGGTYLVYVPDRLPVGRKVPLVFALSPGGDAGSMIRVWARVAETHGWLIAASKEFHNGEQWSILTPRVMAELDAVERDYAVDRDRVVFTGLSGGAMGSLGFVYYHPERIRALVLNTGKMEEAFMDARYPQGKLAVFLASPPDFRYQEMKRDRAYLETRGWKTEWIEFAGGHTFAPPAAYDAAAAWLEQHW